MRHLSVSILVAAFAVIGAPAVAHAQWSTLLIDTLAGTAASERSTRYSVAVDSAGAPHAIWSAGTTLLYSRKGEAGWVPPLTLSQSDANYVACALSMVPGTSRPAVLFARRAFGATVDRLLLAEWNGAGFDVRTLTTDSVANQQPALAMDAGGSFHVVCVVFTGGQWRIRYLTNASGTVTEQLLPVGQLGDFGAGATPAVSVEADGRAHVVYRALNDPSGLYRIQHAENSWPGDSLWSWEELVTPNLEDSGSDVRVDASGTLHVAVSGSDCQTCTRRTYVFERRPGQAWSAPVPIVHSNGLGAPVLAVGSGGGAQLAVSEVSGNLFTGRVFHAASRSGWTPSLVIGSDHGTPSLAVDAQGSGHLMCTTGPNTGVRNVLYLQASPTTAGVTAGPAVPASAWSATPNPFTARTVLRLSGNPPAGAAHRNAALVLDVAGRVVRRLAPARARDGVTEFEWDGRGADGRLVAAGVYRIVSAGAGAGRETRALTVVRLR
jgi:hypothetical protein